jgi:sarcosine oxidase subunit alpha
MSRTRRLASGGRIDRTRPVEFQFDGKSYTGFVGDTVASALLAAGVRLVGRSFRLHRPRGLLSCGLEEPNGLVHVRVGGYEEPNARATVIPVQPNLQVFSQNAWPSVRWDVGAAADLLPKLWSAGFYQKTFMWPSWHWYEPLIRRAAGIGRVRSPKAREGTISQQDLETDVLVCGAGSAGIIAANEAARNGADVTLLDGEAQFAGWQRAPDAPDVPIAREVRVLRNALAAGVFGERVVLASQELGWGPEGPHRRLLRIRARALIVATGALEQPLVFEHNDLPGVMLSGAVTRYLDRFGVRAGDEAVLVTNNDGAYYALERWAAAGVAVNAIVDSRTAPCPKAQGIAAALEIPIFTAPRQLTALGRLAVRGLRVQDSSGRIRAIRCDVIAMAGGWVPNVHLFSQARGELLYERALHAYAPSALTPGVYAVGGAAGLFSSDVSEEHAVLVGRTAAGYTHGDEGGAVDLPRRAGLSPGPTRFPGQPHRQWLDFQHDVTVADASAAVEQGFTKVEHFKRFTTMGMAVDQGKTSLRNSLEQLAGLSNVPLADLKPPTYRPPYSPLPLAMAAGPNTGRWYRPERHLPCHAVHVRLQGKFDDVGGWRRPLHYARAGDPKECIESEIRAVRTGAGLFDSSPLGKIEVSGPDALEFLDRLYVNNLKTLQVGRIRYVLMLRDDGTVLDDGTVARLAQEEYLVTTTSGNAARAYLWMREWAECEWPALRVIITPITTGWGSITVSGPAARAVLAGVGTDVELSAAALPHMSIRTGSAGGLEARICRVSFTGELSYEVNVAADRTAALWQALEVAGEPHGLQPYGIDALNVLRTEKGYLHIGAETDATTTPLDLGWAPLIERKSGDFIGKGALSLAEYRRADRLHLVGLVGVDTSATLATGAHLIRSKSGPSEGYLTTACFSPTLGHAIALARLERGRERIGTELWSFDQGVATLVRVVDPTFYDSDNTRLNS